MRKTTYKNRLEMVKNNISGLKGLQQNMAECLQVEGCMFSRIEEKHIEDEGPSIS
jgi:hypothetical protein